MDANTWQEAGAGRPRRPEPRWGAPPPVVRPSAGAPDLVAAPRGRRGRAARRPWADLAAVAGLLALALAFYAPLTTSDRILYDFDVWVFFYPLHQYAADALRAGRFPLWSPEVFLGAPFFANAQTGVLYPLNVVFLLFAVPAAYTVSLWLHTWLAGAFTYLFARRRLDLGVAGALVAALAFSLGGFMTGLAGHLNQLQAAAWLPLLAWLLTGAIQRQSVRWAVGAAAVLALQTFAGHSQEVYLTLVALGVLAVLSPWWPSATAWTPAAGGRRPAASALSPLVGRGAWALALYALMALLGLGLAAVQLVPTAELQREGIRGGGLPYGEAISFSLPPPLLLQSLLPGFWRAVFGEYAGHIGTIALGLAVVALAVAPPRVALVGGALAGLGLFLALGGYNPLYPLLYEIVPGLGLFRVPARWLFVYSFGAALLAGIGAEWVWRASGTVAWRRLVRRWRVVVVAALAVGTLAVLFALSPPLGARRFVLAWAGLALLTAGLVGWALRGGHRWAVALLVAAVAAELLAASAPADFRQAIPSEVYRSLRPALAPLFAEGGRHRVLPMARDDYALGEIAADRFPYPNLPPAVIEHYTVASKHNEVLTGNLPLEYGLMSVDGYDGGVLPLRRWVEFMRLLVTEDEPRPDGLLRHRLHYLPDERLLALLDVRWVLTSSLRDATVEGVPFDRLATRRLRPGERYVLPVPETPATTLALLSSVADTTATNGVAVGRVTVVGADGSAQPLDVHLGRHTGRAVPPSEAGTLLPTAPPPDPRLRNVDYLARLPLAEGTTVAGLEFENVAPSGTWLVRAATLLAPDGTPHPLPLTTAFELVPHDDPSPVKLYRARAAPPTVWLVPETVVADDPQALAFLRGPAFAPERTAVVAPTAEARALAAAPDAPAGSARVVERLPEHWTIETDAPGERLLVIPQAFFPGWEATIDGAPAPVVRANYLLQGVYVPAGTRRVEIVYRPRSVLLGLLVSFVALLGAAVVWARPELLSGPLARLADASLRIARLPRPRSAIRGRTTARHDG
jgi:hypothetical protein